MMPPTSRRRRAASAPAIQHGGLPLSARLQPAGSREAREELFQAELDAQTAADAKLFRDRAELSRRASRPLVQAMSFGESDRRRLERIRAQQRRRARRKPAPVPDRPPVAGGTWLGSLTQVLAPPYDFWWLPESTTGAPSVSFSADNESGALSLQYLTDENASSSVNLWAAVGSFWAIPSWVNTQTGTLRLATTIDYSFVWNDDCWMDSVSSFAQALLNLEVYDWSGQYEGLQVNQWQALWSDNGWWSGGSGQASSSVTLSATTQVDSDHFYNVWGMINCQASADGDHSAGPFWFWYSDASGTLTASVPSITMTFG